MSDDDELVALKDIWRKTSALFGVHRIRSGIAKVAIEAVPRRKSMIVLDRCSRLPQGQFDQGHNGAPKLTPNSSEKLRQIMALPLFW
jgi:hypothetical protein